MTSLGTWFHLTKVYGQPLVILSDASILGYRQEF